MNLRSRVAGGHTDILSLLWMLAVIGASVVAFYLLWLVIAGAESVPVTIVCVLLAIFLVVFAYRLLNPDRLRSQYTEETLSLASDMLEDMRGGLTPESAEAICRHLLPETHASTIAVTDESRVLACVGDMAEDFPSGSAIHTPATHYVIEHGIIQSFTQAVEVRAENGRARLISAGIVAPLKVSDHTVGALKFYFRSPHAVNRTQYALVSGFADLISTQLAIHELELQEELTARAEVRALQAQINPHFSSTRSTPSLPSRAPIRPARASCCASSLRSTARRSIIPARSSPYRARSRRPSGISCSSTRGLATTASQPNSLWKTASRSRRCLLRYSAARRKRSASWYEGRGHTAYSRCGAFVRRGGDFNRGVRRRRGHERADRGAPFRGNGAAGRCKRSPSGGAGVAMHNIFERIQRFYGPNSSAHVESHPGEGTTITLHLDLLGSIFVDG